LPQPSVHAGRPALGGDGCRRYASSSRPGCRCSEWCSAPHWCAIGSVAEYVAAAALVAAAAWMILSDDDDEEEAAGRLLTATGWTVIALGLSIRLDELAIGFTLGLAQLPAIPVIVALGVQALIAAQLG
jgi:manganese efflux pump family protein